MDSAFPSGLSMPPGFLWAFSGLCGERGEWLPPEPPIHTELSEHFLEKAELPQNRVMLKTKTNK